MQEGSLGPLHGGATARLGARPPSLWARLRASRLVGSCSRTRRPQAAPCRPMSLSIPPPQPSPCAPPPTPTLLSQPSCPKASMLSHCARHSSPALASTIPPPPPSRGRLMHRTIRNRGRLSVQNAHNASLTLSLSCPIERCLFLYLPINPSIYPSIYLSIYPSIYLSALTRCALCWQAGHVPGAPKRR